MHVFCLAFISGEGFVSSCSDIGAIKGANCLKVKLRIWSMAEPKNIVGPQVRRLRYRQGMTQEQLAARCGVLGWDLSRATLSKIEAQLRCVTDREVEMLANALKARINDLFR